MNNSLTDTSSPYQCPEWAKLLFATIQDLRNLKEDEYLVKGRENRQKLLAHPSQCDHNSCKAMCVLAKEIGIIAKDELKENGWKNLLDVADTIKERKEV